MRCQRRAVATPTRNFRKPSARRPLPRVISQTRHLSPPNRHLSTHSHRPDSLFSFVTNTPFHTPQQSFSAGARRKQRSADQLLSRVSQPIPLTSAFQVKTSVPEKQAINKFNNVEKATTAHSTEKPKQHRGENFNAPKKTPSPEPFLDTAFDSPEVLAALKQLGMQAEDDPEETKRAYKRKLAAAAAAAGTTQATSLFSGSPEFIAPPQSRIASSIFSKQRTPSVDFLAQGDQNIAEFLTTKQSEYREPELVDFDDAGLDDFESHLPKTRDQYEPGSEPSELDEDELALVRLERQRDDDEFNDELEKFYQQFPDKRPPSSKPQDHLGSDFESDDYSAFGDVMQRDMAAVDAANRGTRRTTDNFIELDGVRVPLSGFSAEEAAQLLKSKYDPQLHENADLSDLDNEFAAKNDAGDDDSLTDGDFLSSAENSDDDREYMQSIGFSPEELDGDKPRRLNYHKLPTPDQIPLLNTRALDFSHAEAHMKSVLNWDALWPEHLSTSNLSLRVCVLGTPNAGKSALVNNITRARVTAVSAKRNTTRRRVLGVMTEGSSQVTLYDTPGINEIRDAKQYQRDLATEAWEGVADADVALVVLDAAKRIGGPELFLLHKCSEVKSSAPHLRWVLALNKIDLVHPKDRLLDLLYRIQTLMPFDDCFMISGLDGDGVADLEQYFYLHSVPRDWEHGEETKTDLSDIQVATELIRETLYHRLNKEIPYTVQQETVEWQTLENGTLRLDQRLVVRRQQHKNILIGANGAALRNITKAAQERLETAFRRKVSLYLRVSVSVTQDFEGN